MVANDAVRDGRKHGKCRTNHVPGVQVGVAFMINGQSIKNQKGDERIDHQSNKKGIDVAKRPCFRQFKFEQIQRGEHQNRHEQVRKHPDFFVQPGPFRPNQIRLHNEQNQPQQNGYAVGMHPVVFLVQYFGEIGVPETHDCKKEEADESNDDVLGIEGR